MAYIITRLLPRLRGHGLRGGVPGGLHLRVPEYPGSDRAQWPNQLYIHPDECIDCGAGEPVCPTNAISDQVAVSENWKNYVELNAAQHCRKAGAASGG